MHFTRSDKSQAAGREFLKRFRLRAENRDPEVNEKVAPAQIEAMSKWGAPREKPFESALVVNGGKDVIIYSVNSFILQCEESGVAALMTAMGPHPNFR